MLITLPGRGSPTLFHAISFRIGDSKLPTVIPPHQWDRNRTCLGVQVSLTESAERP